MLFLMKLDIVICQRKVRLIAGLKVKQQHCSDEVMSHRERHPYRTETRHAIRASHKISLFVYTIYWYMN